MQNFQRKLFFERRTKSIYKPLIYLLIQIVLIWEVFWILTGDPHISKWNYFELFIIAISTIFFIIKTYKIINRPIN